MYIFKSILYIGLSLNLASDSFTSWSVLINSFDVEGSSKVTTLAKDLAALFSYIFLYTELVYKLSIVWKFVIASASLPPVKFFIDELNLAANTGLLSAKSFSIKCCMYLVGI